MNESKQMTAVLERHPPISRHPTCFQEKTKVWKCRPKFGADMGLVTTISSSLGAGDMTHKTLILLLCSCSSHTAQLGETLFDVEYKDR